MDQGSLFIALLWCKLLCVSGTNLQAGGFGKMALWRLGENFGTLSTPLLVKDLGKMRRCKEVEVALCISCDDKRCNVLNSNVVNSCGL